MERELYLELYFKIMSWLNHHVTNFYQVCVYKINVNPGKNKDIFSKSNSWVSLGARIFQLILQDLLGKTLPLLSP